MKLAAVLVLIFATFFGVLTQQCSSNPFGNASPYNLYSLGSVSTSESFFGGKVASRQSITLSGSTVMGESAESSQYSIVSGSTVSLKDVTVFNGGVTGTFVDAKDVSIFVDGTNYSDSCCASSDCVACTSSTSSPVNFGETDEYLLKVQSFWLELPTSGGESGRLDSTVYLTCDANEDVVVFSDVSLVGASSVSITCSADQTVLINYNSLTSVLDKIGFNLDGGISSNQIIHHFSASHLKFSHLSIPGSVFAPTSLFQFSHGSIAGNVIVGNFVEVDKSKNVDFQFVNAPFTGCIPVQPLKPNILFFLTDDLGWADLSCYGASDIHTPNIDKLAYGGKKLNNYYTPPMCSPARAALMTGRQPTRSGAYNSKLSTNENTFNTPPPVFYPRTNGTLSMKEILLPQLLKPLGYSSAIVGKWHLGSLNSSSLPLQRGFDHFWGMPYSSDMGCPPGVGYPCLNTAGLAASWVPVPLYNDNTIIAQPTTFPDFTPRMNTEGKNWITKAHDEKKPFFLWMNYVTPHVPLFTSPKFVGVSQRGAYGDTVVEIDSSVGELVDHLESLGMLENTLVVFTSDNGPSIFFKAAGGSAGPFKGGKGQTYEGGVRVPSIWYWRSKIDPATMDFSLTSALDVFTTFATVAGAKIPTDRTIDGLDLSRVLFDNAPLGRQCLPIYAQGVVAAVRCGKYKLHYYLRAGMMGATVPANPPVLYNVVDDASELYPLDQTLAPFAAVVQQINAFKAQWDSQTDLYFPAQFDLYSYAPVFPYQPCCNYTTNCYCPPPALSNSELPYDVNQMEEYTAIIADVCKGSQWEGL